MNIKLQKSEIRDQKSIIITGSKSESNRLLLLKALYPNIHIENLSNADDSVLMEEALASNNDVIDIHHAGTAMRFLTAYFAIQEGREVTLTGSSRMKERPIKILVDALRQLGAEVIYVENESFPPLKIRGTKITKNEVSLSANISSQYISALMLIAPKLENGLTIKLVGNITSRPYIEMTRSLLVNIGVATSFEGNTINIQPFTLKSTNRINELVESDWSSASYYFSCIALSKLKDCVSISCYKEDSLQGDSVLLKLYKSFGVQATFHETSIKIEKIENLNSKKIIRFDLKNSPDIAQTIAVTAFGLGLECHLTGLHTLKIKETDRLVALKTELEKLGAYVYITDESFHLEASSSINRKIAIETYNDHRMAMAFAPLALKTDLEIVNADVVTKSYPDFWKDLKFLGFVFEEN